MKNRMVWKLSVYFVAALLTFSLIVGGVFICFFRASTIELHKNEFEQRAKKIAETLSSLTAGASGKGQGGGYGAYIKYLSDIAMADVWVVDEDLNILTVGNTGQHQIGSTSELPSNAGKVVREIFEGKTEFSENFSSLLEKPALTVGTPIKSADGTITGAVLLHSPIDGIDLAVSKGVLILLFSIGAALVIAVILSIGFSVSFTKPLKKINQTAVKLAEGDYTVKTNVCQNDEIGTLAGNMDILSERLEKASRESEKLEVLRRDFVANVSHELRTPVTVIRGSLEALNDGVVTDSAQIKEYYAQMLSESGHLQRLIGDLLDLSRLQNAEFDLEKAEICVDDLISDVLRSVKSLGSEKNIAVSFQNDAKGSKIYGDYGRLRQMLLIIADNAVKFSPRNGRVSITLKNENGLRISVRDEGPGISAEELPFIFDRFYKTKSDANRNGTGLGLAIAKQIALRHGADIKALSEKGVGSEFIIIFDALK